MSYKFTCAILTLLYAGSTAATTLKVGVGQPFTTLQAAATAARDGDTVDIFPGTYSTGAVWTANNLTLELAPGSPAGSATIRGTVNNKGVFDIKGDDAVVDGLRLEYGKSTDANGAGIRAEGHNITVKNSSFYANEMGILITPIPGKQGGDATITATDFDSNGTTRSGYIGHAVYGNYLGTLTVSGSTFTREKIGHYVKSRALRSTITNNRIDDTDGTASYLINIPQGGAADIENNILIKGAHAANCCIAVSYGEEMHKGGQYVNPPGVVTIATNGFTNLVSTRVDFVVNKSTPANPVTLTANTLAASAGSIVPLSGPGTVDGVEQ